MHEVVPITQNPRPRPRPVTVPPPVPALEPATPPPTAPTVSLPRMITSRPSVGDHSRFLKSPLIAALSFVEPTWRDYLKYVEAESAAGNSEAKSYIHQYLLLTEYQRKNATPEQICALAHVPHDHLLRWVTGQAFMLGASMELMAKSFKRGPLMSKIADFAMESPDNVRHAELFMKSAGMLPQAVSRGGINIPIYAPGGTVGMPGTGGGDGKANANVPALPAGGLRTMDDDIIDLAAIMQNPEGATEAAAERMADEPVPEDDDEDEDDDEGKD